MILCEVDLKKSPLQTCNEIFNFLGLENFQVTLIEKEKQNPAKIPRSKIVQKLIVKQNPIRSVISSILRKGIGKNV